MAERLTRIIEDGPISVLSVCQARVEDVAIWREWSVSKDSSIKEALLRLAAYEDTGLTPEEVAALKERTADAWLQLRTATFSTDKGAADLAKFILSILPEAPKEANNDESGN